MQKKSDFEKLRKGLIRSVKEHGFDHVSTYCALTFLPVLYAYEFVKEDLPEYTERCDQHIEAIKEFFGYKE